MSTDMLNLFAQILVFMNSTGIIFLAYFMGKQVQRLQTAEENIKELHAQNTDVALAELKTQLRDVITRVDRVHTNVHDMRNEIMKFLGRAID
jgi:hypothetical protein